MPKRVAALVEQCWHRVPGGTATSTVQLLESIHPRSDWDVVGLAALHLDAPPEHLRVDFPIAHSKLPRQLLYESWSRREKPTVKKMAGEVDIVHATGGAIPPHQDIPLVVTIHDLAFLHHPEFFSRRGVTFMLDWLDAAIQHAAAIVVPSQATADDLVDHGVEQHRIHITPWGVTPRRVMDDDRARVRVKYGLPDDYILWVGTNEPRKNLPFLLEAHARAETGLPLLLVGPKGWGMGGVAAEVPEGVDVFHLGVVPALDLAALYDLATVFVYPSLMEGFGMPVLESMAQGTPVITTGDTATADVAGDTGLLIDPQDSDQMVIALRKMVLDDELRADRGVAARERAMESTWERCAEATVQVYDSVVKGRD